MLLSDPQKCDDFLENWDSLNRTPHLSGKSDEVTLFIVIFFFSLRPSVATLLLTLLCGFIS